MNGVSECVFRVPVGKTTIVCTFTDGNLQSRVPAPATFATENPIIQTVIESCDMFRNNKIFLMSVSGEVEVTEEVAEETKTPAKKTKKAEAKKTRVIESVKTFGDAVTTLMTENDVVASDLADMESVIRKAAELGISFPNLK